SSRYTGTTTEISLRSSIPLRFLAQPGRYPQRRRCRHAAGATRHTRRGSTRHGRRGPSYSSTSCQLGGTVKPSCDRFTIKSRLLYHGNVAPPVITSAPGGTVSKKRSFASFVVSEALSIRGTGQTPD